jgi:hypothetical protein
METVRLPEVWVITSKSISHNAKDRIEEKFKSRKIHFFEADWLVEQIDRHAPHFWEEIDGAVGHYLSALDKRLGVITAQTEISLLPQATTFHMEIDVEEIESDRYLQKRRQAAPRLVNLKSEALNNRVSIIEAEMGFGKSHLARTLASHFANNASYKNTETLPVYAAFKTFVDSGKSLKAFIEDTAGQKCLENSNGTNSKILIILDGIDEALSNHELCKTKIDEILANRRKIRGGELC